MFDRILWKQELTKTSAPAWPCSNCPSGTLKMVAKSMDRVEQTSSIAARTDDNWEPEWSTELFHCRAECSNCRELAFIVGTTRLEQDWDEDVGMTYSTFFRIESIVPAPPMLSIPPNFPKASVLELEKAFALFWSDCSASLNRLRCCLERLCDNEKVPKFIKLGTRDRRPANLHQRLEKLPAKFDDVREQLLALKWLGNDGTHGGEAKIDDVLDALQLLDFIFTRVYTKPENEVAAITRAINAKKGSRYNRKK